MCVCISLCTNVIHNTAQISSDNFPSYPPDNHHSSDDVYWTGGELCLHQHWATITNNLHDLLVRLGRSVGLVVVQHVSQQFDVVVRHVQLLQPLRQLLRPLSILRHTTP